MTAIDLVHGLVACYWSGGVTQEAAAKLLGIRKAEFGEYADSLVFVAAVERAAWRYYLARFAHAFPETDPRAVRTFTLPAEERDDLWRPAMPAPVTEYRGKDAKSLSPAQPSLASRLHELGTESDPI